MRTVFETLAHCRRLRANHFGLDRRGNPLSLDEGQAERFGNSPILSFDLRHFDLRCRSRAKIGYKFHASHQFLHSSASKRAELSLHKLKPPRLCMLSIDSDDPPLRSSARSSHKRGFVGRIGSDSILNKENSRITNRSHKTPGIPCEGKETHTRRKGGCHFAEPHEVCARITEHGSHFFADEGAAARSKRARKRRRLSQFTTALQLGRSSLIVPARTAIDGHGVRRLGSVHQRGRR